MTIKPVYWNGIRRSNPQNWNQVKVRKIKPNVMAQQSGRLEQRDDEDTMGCLLILKDALFNTDSNILDHEYDQISLPRDSVDASTSQVSTS